MPTYAIGDVQGCYTELRNLLEMVSFDYDNDTLWLTGDLVNRGPDNLATLRFVKELGDRVTVVLGNHDLYLLTVVFGGQALHPTDTLSDVLRSPDCDELCHWLRQLPLIHAGENHVLVHAGIPHIWDKRKAMCLAQEAESAIQGPEYEDFFRGLLGNDPPVWSEDLVGLDRLRCVVNYLTRMRFVDGNGKMDFESKLGFDRTPPGYKAWFQYPSKVEEPVVFGHWASLDGQTDSSQFFAIDTGCVWGRTLTALRLDQHTRFDVESQMDMD